MVECVIKSLSMFGSVLLILVGVDWLVGKLRGDIGS